MRALFALLCLVGCQSSAPHPYDPPSRVDRMPAEALRLSKEAGSLLDSDEEAAEGMLREALGLDLFCGPAHNNLGVLFLKRGDLYEAAQEFEWARKLLPGNPDPRVNLAITLERAGQTAEAIEAYQAALAAAPEYLPAVQGLASLRWREGREAVDSAQLRLIRSRSSDERWRRWAGERLVAEDRRSPPARDR